MGPSDRAIKERFARLEPLCFTLEIDQKTENYQKLCERIKVDKPFTLNNCWIQSAYYKNDKLCLEGFVGAVSVPLEV